MRWLVVLLIGLTGCSSSSVEGASADTEQGQSGFIITRPKGQNDWALQDAVGRLRVEKDCILFDGQLVVFPHGTRLVSEATAVQIHDNSEPISLTGDTVVHIFGSNVPVRKASDWDHSMDESNLARWSECRRRVDVPSSADWWLASDMRVD